MTIILQENTSDSKSLPHKMVHELNNLVYVLQGNLEMILEDLPKDHPCCHYACEALRAAKRAQTLLANPRTSDAKDTGLQQEPLQSRDEPSQGPRKGSIRVLLVDDEPMLLDALQRGLKNMGFEVQKCGDPLEALDLVQADPRGFDAVVSDLIMPQLTGLELAKQIFNSRQDLPIILMSGYQGNSGGDIAAQPGICQVLPKPLRFIELAEAIVNCVESNTGE